MLKLHPSLSNGMPIKNVSKIFGHSKNATTQIYARVMEFKIKSDMDTIQKRLNKKAKKFEEENELNFLREKIVEAEKGKYSHLTKEQLIEKFTVLLNLNTFKD